ncbi:hypothetical protein ACEXQD_16245 [Herbiconiux sp. P15]|uniref:hypothetical protein n=1 Tax=Herbiconiux liukaitaii TaxID=3342799 RepID=UPI0035B849A3
MRNKTLLLVGVAFLAYVLGSRAAKGKPTETVGHQVVRLWNDPKARKARHKSRKKAAKTNRK